MEELSIEEKAKRYDKTIERGNSLLSSNELGNAWIYKVLPELKEIDDDDKIREEIIDYLSTVDDKELIPYESWISWLEKQGGHANFCDKIQIGDKVTRNEYGVLVNLSQLKRVAKHGEQNPIIPKFKVGDIIRHKKQGFTCKIIAIDTEYRLSDCCGTHLPFESQDAYELVGQKSYWSEEDEIAFGDALWCCKQAASIAKDENEMGNAWHAERWLKSLKERYAWKPSEEQMEALRIARDRNDRIGFYLSQLYDDLKKLM